MDVLLGQAPTDPIMSPVIQYGFAGFSVVLLGIVVWMFKQWQGMHDGQLGLQRDTNKIIADNTTAIREVCMATAKQTSMLEEQKELLLTRPCVAERKTC